VGSRYIKRQGLFVISDSFTYRNLCGKQVHNETVTPRHQGLLHLQEPVWEAGTKRDRYSSSSGTPSPTGTCVGSRYKKRQGLLVIRTPSPTRTFVESRYINRQGILVIRDSFTYRNLCGKQVQKETGTPRHQDSFTYRNLCGKQVHKQAGNPRHQGLLHLQEPVRKASTKRDRDSSSSGTPSHTGACVESRYKKRQVLLVIRDSFTYRSLCGKQVQKETGTPRHQGLLHLQEPVWKAGT
jgi:hypothetical protein